MSVEGREVGTGCIDWAKHRLTAAAWSSGEDEHKLTGGDYADCLTELMIVKRSWDPNEVIDGKGSKKGGVLHNNNNKCNTHTCRKYTVHKGDLLCCPSSQTHTPDLLTRADDDSATQRRWQNIVKEVRYKKQKKVEGKMKRVF